MLAVGVLLVVLRHLRGALVAMMRTVWLYKRRWAAVLAISNSRDQPSGTKVRGCGRWCASVIRTW
ncbi:hypothetical protein [Nocardia spumae]|uniref:hypothetical protein n=1 Tax=Nocardia spumae TaxID=2887190 RepID=UPI001D144750|nr:hypothetical protein [Nocardia spumae]